MSTLLNCLKILLYDPDWKQSADGAILRNKDLHPKRAQSFDDVNQ